MIITYHGGECFKVSIGETTLIINPPAKHSPLKTPRGAADIVLSTAKHADMHGTDSFAGAFVIDGPGEYEVAGVVVKGFLSRTNYGDAAHNTIYQIALEGMTLVFLGALAEAELPQEARAAIDETDILFVPVGGEGVLGAAAVHKLAVELEPHIVIPMHFGALGEKDALKKYLKEAGAEGAKAQEKLTVKRKDLEGKEGEVIVLAE